MIRLTSVKLAIFVFVTLAIFFSTLITRQKVATIRICLSANSQKERKYKISNHY